MFANVTTKPIYASNTPAGGGGLLGPAVKPGAATGLLGGAYPASTADLMQRYLQNIFMRRYQPPAIPQQPGMVGSRMGMGGMQYMAPQVQQMAPPGKTEMQRMQEQLAAMQAQMNQNQNQFQNYDSGW